MTSPTPGVPTEDPIRHRCERIATKLRPDDRIGAPAFERDRGLVPVAGSARGRSADVAPSGQRARRIGRHDAAREHRSRAAAALWLSSRHHQRDLRQPRVSAAAEGISLAASGNTGRADLG